MSQNEIEVFNRGLDREAIRKSRMRCCISVSEIPADLQTDIVTTAAPQKKPLKETKHLFKNFICKIPFKSAKKSFKSLLPVKQEAKVLSSSSNRSTPYKEKFPVKIKRKSRFISKIYFKKYLIPSLVGITAVLLVSLYSAFFSPGYDVYYDGALVGCVRDKANALTAVASANSRLTELTGIEGDINGKAAISFRIVNKKSFSDEDTLLLKIMESSKIALPAYAINVNGASISYLPTKEDAENALLEASKKIAGAAYDSADVQFIDNVDIKQSMSPVSKIATVESAVASLCGTKSENMNYTVSKGDTLWRIASINDTTVNTIKDLNPGLDDEIDLGQVIVVSAPVPVFTVKTTKQETVVDEIPFETEAVDSNSIYKGSSEVVQKGVFGKKSVDAVITRINGKEVERKELSSSIISNPVNKIVKVGTKERPKGIGTGDFLQPFYGTITSRFGPRWGSRHTGLDIAGEMGAPIKASDNGTVVLADYNGDYGLMVKLDHANGYQTWYGHMSAVSVKEGQTVAKGDVIGKIGSTGFSTGPHLHFEVRKNGVAMDPTKYLD